MTSTATTATINSTIKQLSPDARERILREVMLRKGACDAFGLHYSKHLANYAIAKLTTL